MSLSRDIFVISTIFLFGFTSSLAISSIIVLFRPSITVRAYRRVFLHYASMTSFLYGLVIVVSHYNDNNIWQEYILILGAVLLFIGSFYYSLLRRKSIITPLIWGLLVFFWSLISPIVIG